MEYIFPIKKHMILGVLWKESLTDLDIVPAYFPQPSAELLPNADAVTVRHPTLLRSGVVASASLGCCHAVPPTWRYIPCTSSAETLATDNFSPQVGMRGLLWVSYFDSTIVFSPSVAREHRLTRSGFCLAPLAVTASLNWKLYSETQVHPWYCPSSPPGGWWCPPHLPSRSNSNPGVGIHLQGTWILTNQ